MSSFKFICLYSLCDEQMNNLISFQYHLNDTYDLTKLQWKIFDAQRDIDKKTNDFMSSINLDVLSFKTQAREKKKKKFNDRIEIIVVTWICSLYLNSSKKRKLIQNVKIDVIFIEKSCTASLMILFQTRKWSYEAITIICAIIYLISVSNWIKKNSRLIFRSEEDQNMKALISKTKWDHDEIFIKSTTNFNLHASFVLYVVSIWTAFS
jgi:hypothetical protein